MLGLYKKLLKFTRPFDGFLAIIIYGFLMYFFLNNVNSKGSLAVGVILIWEFYNKLLEIQDITMSGEKDEKHS